MFAKKKLWFKIIASSLSAISIGSLTSLSINCIKPIYQTNLNASTTSTQASTNTTWNDNSLVATNDYLSNTDTPNGFIKIDNVNKSLTMISWFGNNVWTYDLATSPFITQISGFNASTSTLEIHVLYLPDFDRILVYGTVNTSTVVFQLNVDGTEYYVSESSTIKVTNSSLVFNKTGYLLNLLNPNTAIIYEKNFDTTNSKLILNAQKFSLINFSSLSVTYDASGWISDTKIDSSNRYSLFTLGDILGVYESSDTNSTYLFFKGLSTNSGTTTRNIYIMWIKLSNNSYESINKDLTAQFVKDTVPSLDNAHYKMLVSFDSDGTNVYFAMINDISDSNCIMLGPDSASSANWQYINCVYALNLDTDVLKTYFAKFFAANVPSILNIYLNPYNKRVYVLIKSANYNYIYFSDLFINNTTSNQSLLHIKNWILFPTVDQSSIKTSDKRIDLVWRPIFEKNITTAPQTMNGVVATIVYNNATTATPASSSSQKFTVNNFSVSTAETITFTDFNATIISSYNDLVTKYYYLLPQDVNASILEEFIKVVNVSSATTIAYNSNITLPPDGLTIDETAGTATGTIFLNIQKWWITTSSTEYFQIPIDINLSGLATNQSLSFVVVSNSDVDQTKYNQITQLKTQKYPSEVTAQEILNYFLIYGSGIKLSENNIQFSNSSSGSTTTSDKYITVIANDNDGTLQINWNLDSVLSPRVKVRSGSYTFNNFKFLDSWQQVTLNTQTWTLLKSSKAPFQVSLSDIISCLNLSSSYSTDPTKWTWTPTYSATTDKTNWIKQSLEGNLTGTITYNKAVGEVPDDISSNYLSLSINDTLGTGFLKITDLMGGDANSCLYYNQDNANKTASSYNLSEVNKNFTNILDNSIIFFNNWTTVDALNYQIVSSENNKISFSLSYGNSIQTNFITADGSSLLLDTDWIKQIQASTNNLLPTMNYSFSYDLTKVDYNYNISQSNQTVSIESILSNSESPISLDYKNMTPSKFANSFYNSTDKNYDSFLETFNLVELPKDLDALNYYTISNVQLISDDNKGTVVVLYTFSFPNAGNNLDGSSLTSSVTLNGFPTTNSIANQWLIISTSIASGIIAVVLIICFSILIYKKKKVSYLKLHERIFSEKNINLKTTNRKYLEIFKTKSSGVRNTIHENVINNNGNVSQKFEKHKNAIKKLKNRTFRKS